MKVLRNSESETSDYKVWFEAFYNDHFEKFLRYAYAIVGSKSLAEDVVSEVFMVIWNKQLVTSDSMDLSAYMARSIRNLSLKMITQQSREKQINGDIDINVHNLHDPHYILLGKELERVIQEVIDRLTPHEQLIYDMARNKGLTHLEIAKELGISKHTAQKHLSNVLREFRTTLKKRFPGSDSNHRLLSKYLAR